MATQSVRPTKKQRELLTFIQEFIAEHGYSPSYREIMNGLNYTSVATVALHISNLIARGHLIKRGRSARSLEVVDSADTDCVSDEINAGEEKWLVEKVEVYFARLESAAEVVVDELDELYVLIGALRVLGLEAAARSFIPRLTELKDKAAA